MPNGYTLIAPNGTRYELDAQGKLNSIGFADGQRRPGVRCRHCRSERIRQQHTWRWIHSLPARCRGRIRRITYLDWPQALAAPLPTVFSSDGKLILPVVSTMPAWACLLHTLSNGQPVSEALTANLGRGSDGTAAPMPGAAPTADQARRGLCRCATAKSCSQSITRGRHRRGHRRPAIRLPPDNAGTPEASGAQIIGTTTLSAR